MHPYLKTVASCDNPVSQFTTLAKTNFKSDYVNWLYLDFEELFTAYFKKLLSTCEVSKVWVNIRINYQADFWVLIPWLFSRPEMLLAFSRNSARQFYATAQLRSLSVLARMCIQLFSLETLSFVTVAASHVLTCAICSLDSWTADYLLSI